MDFRSLSSFSPFELLNQNRKPLKRTKIVSTLGPKTHSIESVIKLIDEGMNIARLNFSHGTHDDHLNLLKNVNQAIKSRPNAAVSIMLDTKGPQIRTGVNAQELIILKKGALLEITNDYNHLGTSQRLACSYHNLPQSTSIGKKILFADGQISSIVRKIQGNIVTVEILNDGKLGPKKNMCLPGTVITLPTITQKDQYDIFQFGLKYKVASIAVSFTRTKKDLDDLRKLIIQKDPINGKHIQLISKIENHQAIQNIDEIIQGSDGVMIARGDLGMEVPLEKVVILQKYILQKCINNGKFVITATQMMESMISKPRSTRAEISDVTNAILDGTDSLMTSGETANGQFPYETIANMRKIAEQTENVFNYEAIFSYRKNIINKDKFAFSGEVFGAVALSFETKCNFIFLEIDDYKLPRQLATLRPKAYVCVFTKDQNTKNACTANWGVYCFPQQVKEPKNFVETYGELFCLKKAKILEIILNQGNKKIDGFKIHNIQD